MRALDPDLQARLDGGATTLCRCWQIARTDGVTLGFTDHDRTVRFGGVDHAPETGLEASAFEASTGLSVDNHAVTGALTSTSITEEDLTLGRYNGAAVTTWLVDWQDPAVRTVLSAGRIGEITRGAQAFEAEIVGLSEDLNVPVGRAFTPGCSCRLGDDKCGVNLDSPANRADGMVTVLDQPQRFEVSGLEGIGSGFFAAGALVWTSGANDGVGSHVNLHQRGAGIVTIELWRSPPLAIRTGDRFRVTAGCDKTARTCRVKFDNILNFRGFPHIPGDDVANSYPNTVGAHDGRSLFRR